MYNFSGADTGALYLSLIKNVYIHCIHAYACMSIVHYTIIIAMVVHLSS